MLKVRTLFSGIGAAESSLNRLGMDWELVDFCEVDKYAIKSYCAIHEVSENKNLGDISKVWGRNLPYADLLVWGFPCQDISVAGNMKGIKEGETRSGLYYEGFRILKETKPKYSIIENVKNLVGKQFKADFEQMLEDIESLGYNNYWKVLNAKDYGVPQNRERVFIVSIRKDVDKGFEFPQGFDNGLRLKDMLEEEVEEKYYISQEKTEKLINQLKDKEISNTIRSGGRGSLDRHQWDMVCVNNDIAPIVINKGEGATHCIPCITPDRVKKRQNGRRFKEDGEPMFTLTGQDRHGILINRDELKIKEDNSSSCLDSNYWKGLDNHAQRTGILETKNILYKTDHRIRKLTPKECWRLMGFTDQEFNKAQEAGISNSQLYKQAGNSIVVQVLEHIFKNILQTEIINKVDAI